MHFTIGNVCYCGLICILIIGLIGNVLDFIFKVPNKVLKTFIKSADIFISVGILGGVILELTRFFIK